MTQIERLQKIRHLVWDLYTSPSFEKEETLTHLCDEAIDAEICQEQLREPIRCGQPERDARILAESNQELLEALEAVIVFLPDRNDALNYAATNEGRVGHIHIAAQKAHDALRKAKGDL